MYAQTKIEATTVNETINTVFQVLTITMVGLLSLAQIANFVASIA